MMFSPTRNLTSLLAAIAAAAVLVVGVTPAAAQYRQPSAGDLDGSFTNEILEESREKAGVDEKIGQQLPLDAVFTNSEGQTVTLGEVFAEGKPVVIQMAYYRCPALCGEVMNGMVSSMRSLTGDLEIGKDFEVLTVSIDSRETAQLAAENKDATVEVMGRDFAEKSVRDGWGFWVGDDLNIQRLADALGFRFAWIPEAQQYSHAGVIVLATPDGRVSRYLHGTSFAPQTLRLSVIEASEGTLRPSLSDAFVYYCFSYDASTGKYTATARTLMMIGGGVTVLTMACIIGFLLVAERNGRLRRHPMAGTPLDEANDPNDMQTGAFER